MILPGDKRPTAPEHRRRLRTGLLACAALAVLGAASPAVALEFTMFPVREFVEVGGLGPGDVVDVALLRGGQVIAQAHGIAAFQEPGDPAWVVLVNHPGGPDKCWETSTPDVVAGDVVRATVTGGGPNSGTVDSATVADVAVTQPATLDNGAIVVKGFAQSTPGSPLAPATIEQRLIHAPGGLFDNGTRRLQAPGTPSATLVFDAPGSANWTATYTSLSGADTIEAVDAESRILHFGDHADPTDPASARDLTIFEFGAPEGPFGPLCPPLDRGPSLDLVATSDTGTSSTDDLTRINSPTVTGRRGTPAAGSAVTLYDVTSGVPIAIGTGALDAAEGFTITVAAPLADGLHTLRAGHTVAGPGDTLGPPLAITIDTTAPASPVFTSTHPSLPANDNAPFVRGTAEAGTTVRVFTGAGCTGTALATGSAATFVAMGLQVVVPDDSITTFSGVAEDAAANVSPCASSPTAYREVTPKPLATITSSVVTVRRSNWRVGLVVRCRGPAGQICTGRVSLRLTVLDETSGRRKDIVLATKAYAVTAGQKRTIQLTLGVRARRILANRISITVRARLVATAGTGVATTGRTIILRIPKT